MAHPPPQSGPPTSFKTNVNRAKTKRWVEAKSYSYDGDDWGDADEYDDYNGYDEPPAPAPSKPTGLRQRGQSATHSAPFQNEIDQGTSHGGRHPSGNTVGTTPNQLHYGARAVTNPQPQQYPALARSNSFDRGDERRAFSGPGLQQNLPSPVELSQPPPSQKVPAPKPSDSGPNHSAAAQQAPGQPVLAQQTPYGALPNQPGASASSSFPHVLAGKEQVQSPADAQLPAQAAIQAEPVRQNFRLQSHFDPDQHSQRSQQSRSPAGNHRVASRPEQVPQPNFGSRTHSLASNNSSLDYQSRRDLSQPGHQPPFQAGGSPSHSSDSTSSSHFPPRKSSLSQALPNLNQAPAATNLVNSGGEPHLLRDRTDSTGSGKPPNFVRPADIYKRMQEEREKDMRSQDSSTLGLNTNARQTANDSTLSKSTPVSAYVTGKMKMGDSSKAGSTRNLPPNLEPLSNPATTKRNQDNVEAYSMKTQRQNAERPYAQAGLGSMSHPVLPDVTRMSSFGDIFTSSTAGTEGYSDSLSQQPMDLSSHEVPSGPSQNPTQTDLQHQPSVGLRSVVHQAFDMSEDQMPATPSSKADSTIGRSTSGGTSIISPIISRGPSISRAIPNTEEAGKRLPTPPAGLEETTVDKSTPRSSITLTTPKQVPRKASPSQVSGPIMDDILPPNFIPGHRRNTSTPSPNNSPARTPALESSKLAQQPQNVELAVITPTEPVFPVDSGSRSQYSALGGGSTTTIVKSGDTATTGKQPVDWKALDLEARLSKSQVPSVIDTTTKRQGDSASGSPVTPFKDPTRSRPDSPSKNRVRDLAGKFESTSSSRRGSNHSITQSSALLSGGGQKADDISTIRPVTDRLESFRPHLPGAWESFTSDPPKGAILTQDERESGPREHITTAPIRVQPETPLPAATTARFASPESQNKTTTENEDNSSIIKAESSHQDPFAAVAAAGTALAGALVAAVGLKHQDAPEETVTGAHSDTKEAEYPSDAIEDTIRNPNFPVDTVVPPEQLRPQRHDSTMGEISSEPPTPPIKNSPQPTNYIEHDLARDNPAVSVVSSGANTTTVPERSWDNRSQAMLPPLSTDIRNHHYESDRLRREIVRNLSPHGASEPTTAESESPWQEDSRLPADPEVRAYGHDSMVIPKEYESYWNGSNSGGDLSRSSSNLGRLQSMSPQNQGSDAQITPPKPLQFARATQPENKSTHKNTIEPSVRPTLQPHQFSGEKESGDSLPTHLPTDRNRDDTSPHIPENERRMAELPAAPFSQDVESQPRHPDQTHLPDAALRAGVEPTLPTIEPAIHRSPADTHGIPEFYGGNPEPANAGLHEIGSSQNYPWVPEQSAPEATAYGFDQTSSPINMSYATGATHVENREIDPREHQVRADTGLKFAGKSSVADEDYDLPSPPLPPSAQPKIHAFREIMAMRTPEERIQAYEESRQQFANLNTGLAHWLALKSRELPQHADVFSGLQRPFAGDIGHHKSSPSRSKLSGLRPGAQPTPQPYYQQYLGASQQNTGSETVAVPNTPGSTGSQGFSPGGTGSKTTSQNVQAKGKDFLHSAGLLGGKANNAAKGFFSKGKSKLRGSSGVDKVSSSAPSFDLVSRGMQPQIQPQAGPYSQRFPKEQPEPDRLPLSRPHFEHPSSVQYFNQEVAHSPPTKPLGFEESQQFVPPSTQRRPNGQSETSLSFYQPPKLFSLAEERKLSQHANTQLVPQDEATHKGTIRHTDPGLSRSSLTGTPDSKSERPAIYLNQAHTQTDSNSSIPNESSLPLEVQAPSQLNPAPDPPRLPYPDVGGLFHEGWNYQKGSGGSQLAETQRSLYPISAELTPGSEAVDSVAHSSKNVEQPETGSEREEYLEWPSQPKPRPSDLVTEEKSLDQDGLSIAKQSLLPEGRVPTTMSRPFSFMELASDKSQQPVKEVIHHVPNDGANHSGTQTDRSPSPVSPQRSVHNLRDQYDQTVPAQDDTSDDFLPSEKQLELAPHSRSLSNQFQDPNVHEHPAFRHGVPSAEYSTLRTHHVLPEAPRQLSAEQRQQFPPAVPPHGPITKSWPEPKGAPSFSNPSTPPKAANSALIAKPGDGDSHFTTPVSPGTKTKRTSIFRSFNGRSGNDRNRGRDTPETVASPLSTHTQQKPMSGQYENTKVDITVTSESSKGRNKLQRASTSVVAEQDPGKKKRFSALGSLFGRSNQDKARSKTQVVHSNPLIQHPTFVSQPQEFYSRDVNPASLPQRQGDSIQHPTFVSQPQEFYSRDVNPPSLPQKQGNSFAPQEHYPLPSQVEFYAPGNQVHNASYQTTHQTRQAYPRAFEPPAYVQNTALRQENIVNSYNMGAEGQRSPTATNSKSGLRQSIRGDSLDSRFSSAPAARGRQATHDSYSADGGLKSRPENRPQRTWHTVSASQFQSGTSPYTLHQESRPVQRSQHQPTYPPHSTPQDTSYPAPPPPPPKDNQQPRSRHTSLTPNLPPHLNLPQPNPSPSPSSSPRIPLPPIQTNMPTKIQKTSREKAEMRRSRQLEIEHGITRQAESNSGNGATTGTSTPLLKEEEGGSESKPLNKKKDEVATSEKELVPVKAAAAAVKEETRRDSIDDDDVVVMSPTSYPGMEWQPREFSRWDGD